MICVTAAGTVASAAMSDAPIADIVFHCEDDTVAVGDLITVEVYIENYTHDEGFLACDIPVKYDKSMLELSFQEVLAPKSWGNYYRFLFNPGVDSETGEVYDYCWLRVLPDIPSGADMDYEDFVITESKALGFRLVFTAKAEGETVITVKKDAQKLIDAMIVVITNFDNYPAKNNSLTVKIGDYPDDSSAATPPESSTEQEPSEEPESSAAPNESEDIPPVESSNDVSESVEPDESSTQTESADESGDTASSETSDESSELSEDSGEIIPGTPDNDNSGDTDVSGEVSGTPTEDSSAASEPVSEDVSAEESDSTVSVVPDPAGKDGGGLGIGGIIAIVGVIIVAGAAAAYYFLVYKKGKA